MTEQNSDSSDTTQPLSDRVNNRSHRPNSQAFRDFVASGWDRTPLTAEALADKPAEGLVATIVGGRPGTPMPPFQTILSEAEAEWIVYWLMRGFPADAGLPQAAARN